MDAQQNAPPPQNNNPQRGNQNQAQPAETPTVVSVTSSNPAVARVEGEVVVESGKRVAEVNIVAGEEAGEAEIWLQVGETTLLVQVVVGESATNQTVPAQAAPVGVCLVIDGQAEPECAAP